MFSFLEVYEELTTSEKKALKYIIDNPEEIPHLHIEELAKKVFTSKTVIINLSKKLGFSGFKELKYHISNQLLLKVRQETETNESVKQTLEQSIAKSMDLIVEKDIEESANTLKKAKNIFIMARGTSKPVGYYLEHLLFSLGMHCFFINDYNLSETFTRLVGEEDVVILISLSGNTKKIIETAKQVHFNDAKIISMTGFQTNPLSNYADFSLFCYTDTMDTRKDDSVSRIGFFILVDLLINTLKKNNN
ncbi:MAG: MurR/RpiR family transcriptional regulator [Vagococcus sp.]|uniref:MurR/RpiR family transcriptional regulator n=1 Tax=Vagococcus TaxID=2737 RepID=UPI002FC749C2